MSLNSVRTEFPWILLASLCVCADEIACDGGELGENKKGTTPGKVSCESYKPTYEVGDVADVKFKSLDGPIVSDHPIKMKFVLTRPDGSTISQESVINKSRTMPQVGVRPGPPLVPFQEGGVTWASWSNEDQSVLTVPGTYRVSIEAGGEPLRLRGCSFQASASPIESLYLKRVAGFELAKAWKEHFGGLRTYAARYSTRKPSPNGLTVYVGLGEAISTYDTSPRPVPNGRKMVFENQVINFGTGKYPLEDIERTGEFTAAWPSQAASVFITGWAFTENTKKLVSAYLKKYPSTLHLSPEP